MITSRGAIELGGIMRLVAASCADAANPGQKRHCEGRQAQCSAKCNGAVRPCVPVTSSAAQLMAQYDASGLHLVSKGDSVRWTAGARREPAPKSALMPFR